MNMKKFFESYTPPKAWMYVGSGEFGNYRPAIVVDVYFDSADNTYWGMSGNPNNSLHNSKSSPIPANGIFKNDWPFGRWVLDNFANSLESNLLVDIGE